MSNSKKKRKKRHDMSLKNIGPPAAPKECGDYRTSRSFLQPTRGAGRDAAPSMAREETAPDAEPALVDAVRQAFDIDALETRCRQSVVELLGIQTKEGRYKYIDNGSPVLAVAHCDVVSRMPAWFAASRGQPDGNVVFSPALDDRLGVYTILDLLPKLGIAVDVLLTDDEECARSTADLFVPNKEYNWGVEFDRRGEDAVCYQYEDMEGPAARYFRVGRGTFSDISCLQAGCQCLNIGVGYTDEHTETCRCRLEVYFRQIARFLAMYRDLAATTMPYEPSAADEIPTGRIDDYPFHSRYPDFYARASLPERYPDPTRQVSDFREFSDELDARMDEEYFDIALRAGVCPYCNEALNENLDCFSCGRSYVLKGKSFSIGATTR